MNSFKNILLLVLFVISNSSYSSRCDNSLKAKHRDLNLANTTVVGRVVYEGDRSYIEVSESWSSNDPEIFVSHGKFEIRKHSSEGYTYPVVNLRNHVGEKLFFLSNLSPGKVNAPLKRKLTPLDSFPDYEFEALDDLSFSVRTFELK